MTELRRLSWAGVELRTDRTRLLFDPLENVAPLAGFLGKPHDAIFHIEADRPAHALVTHRHPDHLDPETLKRTVGSAGTVFCPRAIADEIGAAGIHTHGMDFWQRCEIDGVEIIAVPAVDWRGDEQVSWVVAYDGGKILHGGDTIWHGQWWRIAREHGAFDWAFLPVNGVIAIYPGMEPSGLPATLTPKQACVAAHLLHAAKLCPMHYGTFNNPPTYTEQDNALGALTSAAEEKRVELRIAKPGEYLER